MAYSPTKRQRFFSSPVTLVIVGLVTAYVVFQVFDVYSKKQYTKHLLEESKTYHSSVSQSYEDITERMALLEDTRGKEAYLREKEGFLLPGEEVYVIVAIPKQQSGATTTEKESFFRKIIPFY